MTKVLGCKPYTLLFLLSCFTMPIPEVPSVSLLASVNKTTFLFDDDCLTEDAVEELYHQHDDFLELDNLAVKPEYKDKLIEMRAQLKVAIKAHAPGEGGELIAQYLHDPE